MASYTLNFTPSKASAWPKRWDVRWRPMSAKSSSRPRPLRQPCMWGWTARGAPETVRADRPQREATRWDFQDTGSEAGDRLDR